MNIFNSSKKKTYTALAAILVCIIFAGMAYLLSGKQGEEPQPELPVTSTEKESLFLFVPGPKGGLEKKAFEIRKTLSERSKADFVFQELRKAKAIPASARLQELAFGEGGVLYLDISRGLIDQQLDARGEIRVVYALVNSFIASFKEVTQVQLLVDGLPLHTLFGVVYTYAPLPFNNDLQEE